MENSASHNLENKINKVFMKKIKFLMCQNKKLLALKHVTVIVEKLKDEDILNKAALILRKLVLQAKKTKLPSNLSVQNLKNGEVLVPEDLLQFYFTFIARSNNKKRDNFKCICKV